MAAVVGGAFWLVNDDDATTNGSLGTPTPSSPVSPSTSHSAAPGYESRAVPVYYVGDTPHGKKLFREFHQEQVDPDQANALALAAASAALSGQPSDRDYTNPWPADTTDSWGFDYDPSADLMTISLPVSVHGRPAGMSTSDAELAVQQLIYSAQAGLGKGRVPVQLLIDGKHTDTVLGVPASEPLAAGNPDDVLAPVQIDSPADGDTVSGTFTVTGRAAVFEANVVWELKQGSTVVKHGFTMATECCVLSPYSFQVTAPPGTYTLVTHDSDESGQGRPVNEDTKEITVK
jgi:hypothetical protein